MGGNRQEWGINKAWGSFISARGISHATVEEVPDDSGTRFGPLVLECYSAVIGEWELRAGEVSALRKARLRKIAGTTAPVRGLCPSRH